MSEIRNDTMNFGSGRALRALDLLRKSACTEIHSALIGMARYSRDLH